MRTNELWRNLAFLSLALVLLLFISSCNGAGSAGGPTGWFDVCATNQLKYVHNDADVESEGNYRGSFLSQGERGMCFETCHEKMQSAAFDTACHLYFPGERGGCRLGQLCSDECLCVDAEEFNPVEVIGDEEDTSLAGRATDPGGIESKSFVDKDFDTYCVEGCNGKQPDCDDTNSKINPGSVDFCDGIDNNCDSIVDNTDECGDDAECEYTACADYSMFICRSEMAVKVDGVVVPCDDYCRREKGSEDIPEVQGKSGLVIYCTYDVGEVVDVGMKPYYVYLCDPDDPDDACDEYFYNSEFEVCQDDEKDFCFNEVNGVPIDDDCDGLANGLDSDCFSCDPYGEPIVKCDLINKKYCALVGDETQWVEDETYCANDICGRYDSSCSEAVEPCEEGETSCGLGCFPGACDIASNKVCTAGGTWEVPEDYCSVCGTKDYDCWESVLDCEEGACDYVAGVSCAIPQGETQPSWQYGGTEHCLREWACGAKYDSDCDGPCEPGACDQEHTKYCTSTGEWSGADDYCDHCGYTDANCGMSGCEPDACDYNAKKVCVDGAWTDELAVPQYCITCPRADDPDYDITHLCTCDPQEQTEVTCNNGQDDDCDGAIDCADSDCEGVIPTEIECANHIDDDCDGLVDCDDVDDCDPNSEICLNPPCFPEGDTETCGTDVGLCEYGTRTCTNGDWSACEGAVEPQSEICNSFDDDCDDSVDEGCGDCGAGETRVCGSITGECGTGLQVCSAQTGLWSVCYGSSYTPPAVAETCDGLDNDCDGEIDEGCTCTPGETQPCGEAIGECKPGNQTCLPTQEWGECVGQTQGSDEICDDGLDNDCDGFIDMADDFCDPNKDKDKQANCHDTIKNQGEEMVDCGGPCEPCNAVSCNDRKKNGDETGLDCGGSKCPPCKGEKVTGPKVEVEEEPECGDGFCEDDEDEESCPEDCVEEEEKEFPVIPLIVAVLVLAALGGAGALVYMNIKAGRPPFDTSMVKNKFAKKPAVKGKPVEKPMAGKPMAKPMPAKPMPAKPARPALGKRKKIKSREEEALEKSFKQSKETFK